MNRLLELFEVEARQAQPVGDGRVVEQPDIFLECALCRSLRREEAAAFPVDQAQAAPRRRQRRVELDGPRQVEFRTLPQAGCFRGITRAVGQVGTQNPA